MPADLKKYALDRPQGQVTVSADGSDSTLMIGGSAGGENLYMRNTATALVATADGALLKDLQRTADEFRQKQIFALRGYLTERLEFTRDGQTMTTDGPFAETKEALGGFYQVEAKDLDEALRLAAACPGAKWGSIEVRPIVDFSAGQTPG